MTHSAGKSSALIRHGWLALLGCLILGACGGGESPLPVSSGGNPATSCDANGSTPASDDDCGEVLIGLTDAAGDFVTYTVDVTALTLVRADGVVVNALPGSARIDFAQYTELTEFLTAATVPPGIYRSGTISLDYSDAEILVENGDEMSAAVIVDEAGQALGQADFEIFLDQRRQLVIRPGLPSLLTVDFDLAASHEVDLTADPITATAEPFLLAEVDPVDSKEMRLRGPLLDVSLDAGTYTIAIRPLNRRDGHFGRTTVHTDSATVFEIDGLGYEGEAGLRAMATLTNGTPTVAFGKLNVATRTFLAATVYAGSSVPGHDLDVVRGNVIARNGDRLTLRGAVVIPRLGRAHFGRTVTVIVGDGTRVHKAGRHDPSLDNSAISVGQRINAFGALSTTPDSGIVLDASEGRVRMLVTRLNGTVNTVVPGQVDITLQSIDGRPARLFDFSGTGVTPLVDADPENYEVATGALDLTATDEASPVKVFGFVTPFGFAPPDFEARSFADYSDSRALLAIGWGVGGTAMPFLSIGADGILLDLGNPDIGARHYLRQGGVFTDLLTLPASPLIAPHPDRPGVFAIKQDNKIWIHSDFALFTSDLAGRLDGNTRVRGMYAKGGYRADANLFVAGRIGVLLD